MGAGLNVYVTVFLFRKNRVLLLERGSRKRFAPGRWTGVGGRAEPGEMDDLEAAALREVSEEAGIEAEDIRNLEIRVVFSRIEDGDLTTVVFFSGQTDRESLRECNEGRLQWVDLDRVDDLDLVEKRQICVESGPPGRGIRVFRARFLAVEDAACGGAIRAVRVNPPVSGNSAGKTGNTMKFVIRAGGFGTRLWPYSRTSRPKQFHRMVGERTMLQEAVHRIRPLVDVRNLHVSTGSDLVALVREQLPNCPGPG